ncbi:MAG: NfeD family protein [Halobacteria archaeon]
MAVASIAGAFLTVVGVALLAGESIKTDRFPAGGFAVTGSGATLLIISVTDDLLVPTAFLVVYAGSAVLLYRGRWGMDDGPTGDEDGDTYDIQGRVATVTETIDGRGTVDVQGMEGGSVEARNVGSEPIEEGERVRIVSFQDGEAEVARSETQGSFTLDG